MVEGERRRGRDHELLADKSRNGLETSNKLKRERWTAVARQTAANDSSVAFLYECGSHMNNDECWYWYHLNRVEMENNKI